MKETQINTITGSRRPDINYPTVWQFKIIGTDRKELVKAVKRSVQEQPHSLQDSNVSSGGKYISMSLELIVESNEHRLQILNELAGNKSVKVVL